MNISLTENEERALSEILRSVSACSSGCAYEEMEKSNEDCDECPFTEAIWSLRKKYEIDQICKNCDYSENDYGYDGSFYCYYWDYEQGMSPNRVAGDDFCSNWKKNED